MKREFEEILNLNEKYKFNDFNGNPTYENPMVILGSVPILISAPHAVRSYMGKKLKSSEPFTGAIVEYLCKKYGVNGIVRTYARDDNPSYENKGRALEYKQKMIEIIKLQSIKCVFDIHGMKNYNDIEIDIGINGGKNIGEDQDLLNIIIEVLGKNNIIGVDKRFTASKETIVSNYIHEMAEVPCFQLELCQQLRNNQDRLIEFLDDFGRLIKQIEQRNINKVL